MMTALMALLIGLASIVAGETPGCSFPAKVAAAQVMANRTAAGIEGGWFGQAEPGLLDVLAVRWAADLPDLVDGALYFVGPGDAARMPWLSDRTGRASTWVESWR